MTTRKWIIAGITGAAFFLPYIAIRLCMAIFGVTLPDGGSGWFIVAITFFGTLSGNIGYVAANYFLPKDGE